MLPKQQLLSVINDLVESLNLEYPVETIYLEAIADTTINALTVANKIALLRWMCERLAWMQQGEDNASRFSNGRITQVQSQRVDIEGTGLIDRISQQCLCVLLTL